MSRARPGHIRPGVRNSIKKIEEELGRKLKRTDPEYPDPESLAINRERILALRRSGLKMEDIELQLGISHANLCQFFARHNKREEIKQQAIAAGTAMPKAVAAAMLPLTAVRALAAEAQGQQAPVQPAPAADVEEPGTFSTGDADAILQEALGAAAKTIARAAGGQPVDAQSMQAAKLLMKKYGLLQEEEYSKESVYMKMSDEELCERGLMSLASMMEKRGRGMVAIILKQAAAMAKEAMQQKVMEAA